ncbi:hypothetical protein [Pseudomonas sp. 31-12]|uniref:hypothetical protein n=1 Tax=Pseudomonas sp. 31-12 TaxID=2201356 RepID=UPI0035320775
MTLGPATLRASLIDDERQPEPSVHILPPAVQTRFNYPTNGKPSPLFGAQPFPSHANAFFFHGQYYDYRWPIQLAGYDSINTDAQDPPSRDGMSYVNSAALPTFRNGDGFGPQVAVKK